MSQLNDKSLESWKGQVLNIDNLNIALPHASNLIHKLGNPSLGPQELEAFRTIIPSYLGFRKSAVAFLGSHNVAPFCVSLNTYLALLRDPVCNVFSHQSDFISSVIPEFFCILLKPLGDYLSGAFITTQKDVVIDCVFDPYDGGRLILKRKRVDVSLQMNSQLHFQESKVDDFTIPLIAIEIKTNLDRNMLAGIESSVAALKQTFPLCLYFVITEFADFAVETQNYSATSINEIYVLRCQKRSQFRETNIASNINVDLIEHVLQTSIAHVNRFVDEALSLKDRLEVGKLVQSSGN